MAKLPIQKKILREDLREAPGWVDKIIGPVNSFFESVYLALTRNITFTENIACQIKEVEFTTTSSYDGTAANWTDLTFKKTIKTKTQGVVILQIVDLGPAGSVLSSYRPIEGDVYLDWIEDNDDILIGLIRGLTASESYKVRLLVI